MEHGVRRNQRSRTRIGLGVLLLGLALMAAGCGPTGPQGSRLSGKVTVGGKPAVGATIRFFDDSNQCVAAGSVGSDGAYIATDVPRKQLRVAVEPGADAGIYQQEAPPPGTTPIGGGSNVPPAKIPEKFQKPESSGLSASITKAEQTADFSLD